MSLKYVRIPRTTEPQVGLPQNYSSELPGSEQTRCIVRKYQKTIFFNYPIAWTQLEGVWGVKLESDFTEQSPIYQSTGEDLSQRR